MTAADTHRRAYDETHAEYTARYKSSSLADLMALKANLVQASVPGSPEHEGRIDGAISAIGDLMERQCRVRDQSGTTS